MYKIYNSSVQDALSLTFLTAAPREPVVTGRIYAQMWVSLRFLGAFILQYSIDAKHSALQGAKNANTLKAREADLELLAPRDRPRNLRSKIMTCCSIGTTRTVRYRFFVAKNALSN